MLHTKLLCPGFGLETSAVDASRPLSDAQFAELEQTFFRAQVLVLREQSLTPAQYVAFARRLGPQEPHVIDQFHHPDDPNILILSNRKNKNGEPMGLADAGTYFHTDYSYLQVPARATTLYSIEVPKAGGNTLFATHHASHRAPPPRYRAQGAVRGIGELVRHRRNARCRGGGAARRPRRACNATEIPIEPRLRCRRS